MMVMCHETTSARAFGWTLSAILFAMLALNAMS